MFGDFFAGLARAAEERMPESLGELIPRARPSAGPRSEPEPAPPTRGTVSDRRLGELIEECGLKDLGEGIRSLALRGARLIPEPGSESEQLDPAGIPAAVAVELEQLAPPALPSEASCLWIEMPSHGPTPPAPGPIEVEAFLGELGPEIALLPTPELTLPRAWSAPAQALGLAPSQVERWEALRARLAEAHGVKLTDEPSRPVSVHRLLGYPDERSGQMPLWCELLARGLDPGEEPVSMHPLARELAPAAARWRLLLQLSREMRLGWRWGEGAERLYVWVPQKDLEAGELGGARAFLR